MSPRRSGARVSKIVVEVFGLAELRPGQRAVIHAVLAKRHTLAIMPTGAGKSLCYQVPAMLMPGMTVVVSPLIALMRDQFDKLSERGLEAVQVNRFRWGTYDAPARRSGGGQSSSCSPRRSNWRARICASC